MEEIHRLSRRHLPTLLLLVVLVLLNCYRAATQSVTTDEAFAYERFVSRPLLTSFTTFDAAHHVLHTFGCIAFVLMFGPGAVSLRLTSLIFGSVYFWAVWRLSLRLFPRSWLSFLAAALLTLNPYVLDFMSAARGYGMALALFAAAVLSVFQFADEVSVTGLCASTTLRRLTVLATLAVGANLTFAIPAVTLLATVAIVVYNVSRDVYSIIMNIAAPAAITLCFFAAPLVAATRGDFYFGAASWHETLRSLYVASFDQDWPVLAVEPSTREPIHLFLPYLLGFLGVTVIVAVALAWNPSREADDRSSHRLVLGLLVANIGGCALLVLIGHALIGLHYPYARTSLYVIFLSTLVVLLAVKELARSRQPWRAIGYSATIVMVLIAGLYGLELRTQWYGDWKFDAGTGSLMRSLSGLRKGSSGAQVHMGVSWVLQTSAEFYREIYHMDWLASVTRDEPSCADDYLLVQFLDQSFVDRLGFKVLRQEPVSGSFLAQRTAQSCAAK